MIKVLFFAQVREMTQTDTLTLPAEFATVEALRVALTTHGTRWAQALEAGALLAAVNQTLVAMTHPLCDGDEVAFFPR